MPLPWLVTKNDIAVPPPAVAPVDVSSPPVFDAVEVEVVPVVVDDVSLVDVDVDVGDDVDGPAEVELPGPVAVDVAPTDVDSASESSSPHAASHTESTAAVVACRAPRFDFRPMDPSVRRSTPMGKRS
jgi:hypothetical protein